MHRRSLPVGFVLVALLALAACNRNREPAAPPNWLSRVMNRVPNVHPGRRFEEMWAEDRADESARRDRNEQPWARAPR